MAWTRTQLTFGSPDGVGHSHSYYDIPVLDRGAEHVLAHRLTFIERQPKPKDEIAVGIVALGDPGSWQPLGTSRAWSWQQGPMAQWVAGGPRAVYNDREGEDFVARLVDSGTTRILPRPVYAVDPEGRFALSLNMARLDTLRPGYGYPGGAGAQLDKAAPTDDGVWRMDLETGETRLILSLSQARAVFLRHARLPDAIRARLRGYRYWFNHAKLSPDGTRFTVKLRWRILGKGWSDVQGVSLTAATDGSDVRLLTDATSHVVWLNDHELYCWRLREVALFEDKDGYSRIRQIAPDLLGQNVHMRHLPPGATDRLGEVIFDTPYKEDIDLVHYDDRTGRHEVIAAFANHRPARGPFRCDLHPVPSEDGRTIIVTSLDDGARQVYALRRTD